MKCPYCGAVLNGRNICGGCGKKIEIPRQEVEIEYKEYAYPFNSQGYHILCHALFLFGMFGCTHFPLYNP